MHPGSAARRNDGDVLVLSPAVVKEVFAQEQTLATKKLINEDNYEGVLKSSSVVLPFGLDKSTLGRDSSAATSANLADDLDMLDPALAKRRKRKGSAAAPAAIPAPAAAEGASSFSSSVAASQRQSFSSIVPALLESVHRRTVLLAWIAKNQLSLDPQNQEWAKTVAEFAATSLLRFCGAVRDSFSGDDDIGQRIQISQAVQVRLRSEGGGRGGWVCEALDHLARFEEGGEYVYTCMHHTAYTTPHSHKFFF